ncbi:DUF6225 family protein [Streptomyces yaizuensis]|uniref:DUF6225 family protein n=1 Tax=Streptomyces yaizuensis TaxID=2989713 RepID=A0ABQ5NT96_9ACTN|nr:DUF6225 family protein [Streptomyces sp. YSPA8]GLF93368.1 DUF6225 family protein [Streptomyces sp. YSPA8]
MAETIDHAPQVWTAGQLRHALTGLPDDTPLHVAVADGPGDFAGYSEYALVSLDEVEKDAPAGEHPTLVEYTLFADYKAGLYDPDPV